jgi:hypothetical protein
MEWHSNRKVFLHDDAGKVVEGIELSEAEIEQMRREELLADVLELAVAKLRSGEGWDESTTTDVLNEIEHATGDRPSKTRTSTSTMALTGSRFAASTGCQ